MTEPTTQDVEPRTEAGLREAAQAVDDGWHAITEGTGRRAVVHMRYASDLPARLNALRAALAATEGAESRPERRTGPVDRRNGPGDDLPNLHERRSQHRREGDYARRVGAESREGLDPAWAEAEAELPEGFRILVGQADKDNTVWATASGRTDRAPLVIIYAKSGPPPYFDGPTAALRALAAALRDRS